MLRLVYLGVNQLGAQRGSESLTFVSFIRVL